MKTTSVNHVLAQMKAMQARMEQQTALVNPSKPAEQGEFTNLLTKAIDQVNGLQKTSSANQAAFERGENISLTEVMVASQKSRVAFTGMVEVRNKMLSAYQDIMNMPV